MAGVRTADLEHQKRTLYPLRQAPPGLTRFITAAFYQHYFQPIAKKCLQYYFDPWVKIVAGPDICDAVSTGRPGLGMSEAAKGPGAVRGTTEGHG